MILQPFQFGQQLIGDLIPRASVKEIDHDRNFGPADVASVLVWCILETRDANHIAQVRETLVRNGIEVE